MITSRHNPKIQYARGLLGKPRERQQSGEFVVEGVRLAEEAWRSGWQARQLFFTQGLSPRGQEVLKGLTGPGTQVEELAPEVMNSLSATETSQGLMAIFPMRHRPLPATLDFVLLLDAIRDPGNVGTLLRTAAAAGVQAVAAMPGTADLFSPKAVRAGMGAHFHLPVINLTWDELESILEQAGPGRPIRKYLAEAGSGEICWHADLRAPLALIVSNEAEGATPEALRAADTRLQIPMPGGFESLNAAVAGAILLFEVVRQRNSRKDPQENL